MLSQLIDKLLIIVMCMLMVSVFGPCTKFVIASLFAVIITGIVVVDKFRTVHMQMIIIVYLIISIIMPEFLSFYPLMIYDCRYKRMKVASPLAILFLICEVFTYEELPANTGIIPLWLGILFICLFCIIAFLMQYKTEKYIETESKMRTIRDDATENTLALKSKNAELLEKQDYEIRVATLQERNRIAREIHDNVGHMLTRALLQTGAIKALSKDEALKPQLDSLHDTLNTAMTNIRSSVHDLHDESTDLQNAIRELISRFPSFQSNLEYEVTSDVPKNIKYCFIAITKEALNNAAKHSNGDRINIIVREQPGFYQFMIEDNGTDIPSDFTGGIGIANMKERVRLINGNFNISTINGFRINISIMK